MFYDSDSSFIADHERRECLETKILDLIDEGDGAKEKLDGGTPTTSSEPGPNDIQSIGPLAGDDTHASDTSEGPGDPG